MSVNLALFNKNYPLLYKSPLLLGILLPVWVFSTCLSQVKKRWKTGSQVKKRWKTFSFFSPGEKKVKKPCEAGSPGTQSLIPSVSLISMEILNGQVTPDWDLLLHGCVSSQCSVCWPWGDAAQERAGTCRQGHSTALGCLGSGCSPSCADTSCLSTAAPTWGVGLSWRKPACSAGGCWKGTRILTLWSTCQSTPHNMWVLCQS